MKKKRKEGLRHLTEAITMNVEWAVNVQKEPMTKEKVKSLYIVLSCLKNMADQYDTTVLMGNAMEEAKLAVIMQIIPDLYSEFVDKNLPIT